MKIGDFDTHPAADLFPMLGETELNALAEDIKRNGQRDPVTLYVEAAGAAPAASTGETASEHARSPGSNRPFSGSRHAP